MLRHVTLPLSMPAIMSTALYIFMIAWNEFLFALLFLTGDRDKWTVSLGLVAIDQRHRGTEDDPDGGFGDPHRADHPAVRYRRTNADRGPHRGR